MGNIRLATVTILSQMSSIGKLKCPFDLINFLWLEVMKFLGEARYRDNLLLRWNGRL
jgi:predicted outer membrane lipoprotein